MLKSLMLLMLGGCAAEKHVMVPKTPDGMACYRQCVSMHTQCLGLDRNTSTRGECEEQRHDCLLTCPGAHLEIVD